VIWLAVVELCARKQSPCSKNHVLQSLNTMQQYASSGLNYNAGGPQRCYIDPHSSHIFLPNFLKLKTKKHIRDTNQHAKYGKDRFTGDVWANTQILAVHSGLPFLYFFYSNSLSASVAPRVVRRPVSTQNSCFRPRKCVLGVRTIKSNI